MVTVLTFDTGKAVVQDAAIKIAVNDLPHVGPKKAILFGKAIIVNLFQRFKMVLNALVVLRFLGFSGLVNR